MRDYFYSLFDALRGATHADEVLFSTFAGEVSDFVRFNRNRIRQAGQVTQLELSLQLICGDKQAQADCDLSGEFAADQEIAVSRLQALREALQWVPVDPFLSYSGEVTNTEDIRENCLPVSGRIVSDIINGADGLDLVGFLAAGTVCRGFANSMGQKNWHERPSFVFDWSCYQHADRAIKRRITGTEWSGDAFYQEMQDVRRQMEVISREPRDIKAGRYRVYLAPLAMADLVEVLGWGGFGIKSMKTRRSALLKLADGVKCLHPGVSLTEDHAAGLTPDFTSTGTILPQCVDLVVAGRYANSLVSPRSAKEYGMAVNADSETPQSLVMAPGELAERDIIALLERGLYINNLWYLNYSDRNNCGITGMTRFACFWVENGVITAPVKAMRFDDSIYAMFGDNLRALTRSQQFILDPSTYDRRSLKSIRLPGAIIDDFMLTL